MSKDSNSIAANLTSVLADIERCTKQAERNENSVRLLAVSKTKPVSAIEAAYQVGQRAFGENYAQEAVEKSQVLADLKDIEWHFIGPIQSNKSRSLAETMDWIHTIDREKIARRLSEQRPENQPPLNVCIQINISGEESKSGILLSELDAMVTLVQSLPNLVLRGLMAIPAPQKDYEKQCEVYEPLLLAFNNLSAMSPAVDTLSIGMSGDLPAAISSGSTMVRIGTAIFGERDYS